MMIHKYQKIYSRKLYLNYAVTELFYYCVKRHGQMNAKVLHHIAMDSMKDKQNLMSQRGGERCTETKN